jgi:hypothetical protein
MKLTDYISDSEQMVEKTIAFLNGKLNSFVEPDDLLEQWVELMGEDPYPDDDDEEESDD